MGAERGEGQTRSPQSAGTPSGAGAAGEGCGAAASPPPQLCSASGPGSEPFLRAVYSCCIGNFIAISIMIIGAGSKESKMPLQGEITFDIAIYTSSCQAGARPNPLCNNPQQRRGTGPHPIPAPRRSDPSQHLPSGFRGGWMGLGGAQLCHPHISICRLQRAVTFGERHAGVGPQSNSFGASAAAEGPGEHLLAHLQPQRGSQKSAASVAGGEGATSLNSLSGTSIAEQGRSLQSSQDGAGGLPNPIEPAQTPSCCSSSNLGASTRA